MIKVVDEHLQEIHALCQTFQVRKLELFGSAARGDFDVERSDLDFFVEFEELGWRGSFKRFMWLKLGLEKLFGRSVDLAEPSAIVNPYFKLLTDRHRSLVYAA